MGGKYQLPVVAARDCLKHVVPSLPPLIGLGHAFEMDPGIENVLLYQIADALLSR
jgi:hypothetical protein